MRVLVTGATGFVGRWLTERLLEAGHSVTGAVSRGQRAAPRSEVAFVELDLAERESAEHVARQPYEAVVHLAAVASGAQAREDPGHAWDVNAGGTARLLHALGDARAQGGSDPLVIVASTGEVYGPQARRPSLETDPVDPCSPYAMSKLGAEMAARDAAVRTGLRVVIVRPFAQCGPGQDRRFVLPALVSRLLAARRSGATAVRVGNLEPVRDFVDVRDAARAISALLDRAEPGATYNIATGVGVSLTELFRRAAEVVGVNAVPETDPALVRAADLPYLVGDAAKLRAQTGWRPGVALEQSLADLVAALEADAGGRS